jgi:peptidoglycan/LPS O-acetylase OafA/YrhL
VVQGVDLDAVLFALRDTAMAAWSVWLVGRAATGFTGAGRAVLEWAPLLYLGRISYAMYLIHNFMLLLPIPSNPADSLSTVSRMMILIAVDVALASLSWHVLEMPFDRLKQRLASVPPIIPPAASLAQAPPLRHQQAAATPSAA